MVFLPQGGVVIDTPGIREFHIWIASGGSNQAFPDVDALSLRCHFRDCTHTKENKCAVLEALTAGTLPRERYDSFLKLQLEIGLLREGKNRTARLDRRKRSNNSSRVPQD